MSLRRVSIVLLAFILFTLSQSTWLNAVEQYGWINGRYYGPTPYYIGNPKIIDVPPSQPITITGRRKQATTQIEPNHQAYPYGYFGTQSRAHSVFSSNYYNDFNQWSYRRGY
jgi:hypothetical protein